MKKSEYEMICRLEEAFDAIVAALEAQTRDKPDNQRQKIMTAFQDYLEKMARAMPDNPSHTKESERQKIMTAIQDARKAFLAAMNDDGAEKPDLS